ncbi:MAG: 3-isopropylmalate dehydratase large subunit [Pseudomonadota bacterium]
MPRTLFEKLLDAHLVRRFDDGSALLLIDRIMMHERTGSLALQALQAAGRAVANPAHAFAVMDHIVSTQPGRGDDTSVPNGAAFVAAMREAATNAGIQLFDVTDATQGISHLVAVEQGIALPGLTLVCPDSHTCTLGALGMLAFGIGTTDCEHALATEALRINVPRTLRVVFDGALRPGVTAKDMILALIARYGTKGGSGFHVEFAGPAVTALDMAGRFTLCNMAVEFSAFAGAVSPDRVTLDYLRHKPEIAHWIDNDEVVSAWLNLATDAGAQFDHELRLDASRIRPQVTYGTSPQHSLALGERVPQPNDDADLRRALRYMDIRAGQTLDGLPIDAAYIGSCTNARIEDLRKVATLLKGRQVSPHVRAICVPGSTQTRLQAEREGLDRIFLASGFEWHEAGCGLCFYAGGDGFAPGARVISTTNRNFEGRQGPGVRTHLASPETVAESAVAGCIAGPDRTQLDEVS